MTYIKRLEFHGFKSFANKLSLDLSNGFSTFVGSNGSGKSNVIDALCFVLGKASKKSMRADMLSDLVFNGGKNGRPSKFGEVSLVFDNSNNIFPYESDEFRVTRRVLSKGNSVYKINDQLVKRQEIINVLNRANVNPDGFNIILQGDIQKFVDLGGDERRKVIEDISGVSIYEDKKRKSIRELEKVEDKLKEARTRLAERERYLKEIINDKKQAEKFLKMQEGLRDKKASLLFKKIHDLEQERTEFDDKISKNNDLLKDSQVKNDKARKEIEELETKLNNVRVELAKKGDAEQQAIAKQLEEVKDKKLELENVISNHEREIKRINQRRDNVSSELKDAEFSIKNSKAEIKKIVKKADDLKAELSVKRKSSGVEQEEKATKLREELVSIEESLTRISNELIIAEQSSEYLDELKNVEVKLENHEVNLKRVSNSLVTSESKRTDLYSKKREVDDYLRHLNSAKAKLEARKDAFIDYGTKGVKAIMKNKDKLSGVFGTIAGLGLTDKRYTTALNVAVGSRLNAIVVRDDGCAQDCIELLRRNQAGTAAFIPLNKVSGFSINDNSITKIPGVIDYAINLVKFDNRYRKAFELVLRNTLVVQDLNVARNVGFNKVRMVTVQGDLIETSGLMTGGYRGKVNAGFLSEDVDEQLRDVESKSGKYERYKTEIAEALELLQEEIVKDREEKARLESLINELKESVERLKPKISKVVDVKELESKLRALNQRKKEIKEELSKGVDEASLKIARAEIEELEEKYNELIIKRSTMESELEKVFVKERDRLSEIVTELDNESKVFKQELIDAKKDLTIVKNKLKDLKTVEAKFYKELKELYDLRDSTSKSIDDLEKEINKLQNSNFLVKEKNQDLNIKRASVVAKLDGLRVAFEEFKGWEPKLVRKSVKELEAEINKLEVVIKNFGPVNMKSIETYKEVEKEFEKIKVKTEELTEEKEEVIKIIDGIESDKKKAFIDSFNVVKNNFEQIFARLSPGGIAKLMLEDPDEPFEGGVTALVRPKGKKILTLKSLSGGEKTLTALAFIFAIQECAPAPFYIMDEVDAALDKVNTEKLAEMISEYSKKSQFIVISHNDELISLSDFLYGVSMDKRGVSNIVSIKLPD